MPFIYKKVPHQSDTPLAVGYIFEAIAYYIEYFHSNTIICNVNI